MPFTLALPIADRRASHDFYRDGLGLEVIGEPASDGVPEPLQFRLADGVHLMLVPSGGFGWAIGDRRVSDARTAVGALLSLSESGADAVAARFTRAVEAGGTPVVTPQTQPWGLFAATVTDPDGHLWVLTADA